ncbi:DEKNAAC103130 [Brettanomyces naardenensis]|uniref:DEKNAAC103130 n=1 Tax=Brettanomyces naardenensis TaxID=13370 RepID=A0A448YMJ0_BRENA|nr:DEKNAAC103130 [Brettanomyces naardenensis]
MRASQVLAFKETAETCLRRPWKTYRDGTLFYGQSKAGNKRLPLSTKQGNKNYYKGTRSSSIGKFNQYGKYTINYEKVRTFVIPEDLDECVLRPLVSSLAPVPKNSFKGYEGAADGRLYLDKVKEFIETGKVEFGRSETYVERG